MSRMAEYAMEKERRGAIRAWSSQMERLAREEAALARARPLQLELLRMIRNTQGTEHERERTRYPEF